MAGTRLVVAGLLLIWGGVSAFGEPPPTLRCSLLDERGTPAPRGVLLRIWGGPEEEPRAPREPESDFDVSDPQGVLGGFWGPSGEPPRCELSPTEPLPPPGDVPACPLGRRWWLLALGTAGAEGTALLSPRGHGDGNGLRVSLLVSTLTPRLRALRGAPQTLHCSFAPPSGPFTLEWLHHGRGHSRALLAFDSAAARVTAAAPGVRLLLGRAPAPGTPSSQPAGGALEVSLQLPPLAVSDEGAFVCSVSTARAQAQQVLRVGVIAPPQVLLAPPSLSPALPARLRCDALGFFPLDVAVTWERRGAGDAPGDTPGDTPGGDAPGDTPGGAAPPGLTWRSGHRRAADGTFSVSAGLSLATVTPGDSYTCLVTHLATGSRHRATVRVTGVPGPGVEDVAGVALVAFVIGGLCLRLWPPAGR